jgi:hypothetical protein
MPLPGKDKVERQPDDQEFPSDDQWLKFLNTF